MKRDNKKALYESIMTSVAKEVKKVLNESNNEDENFDFDSWDDLMNYLKDNDAYEGIEKIFDLVDEFETEEGKYDRYGQWHKPKQHECGELINCYTYKALAEYIRDTSKALLKTAEVIENMEPTIHINLIDLCQNIVNKFDMNDWCEWIDEGDDSLISLLNANGVMEFLEKEYGVDNEDLILYIKDNIYKICDYLHDYEPSEHELKSWGRKYGYSKWGQDED